MTAQGFGALVVVQGSAGVGRDFLVIWDYAICSTDSLVFCCKDHFISSFPTCILFFVFFVFSFLGLTALVKNSSTRLTRTGERGHPGLLPNVTRKHLVLSG